MRGLFVESRRDVAYGAAKAFLFDQRMKCAVPFRRLGRGALAFHYKMLLCNQPTDFCGGVFRGIVSLTRVTANLAEYEKAEVLCGFMVSH